MRGDVSAEYQPSQIEVANNTTSNLFDAASPTLHIFRGHACNGLGIFSKTAAMPLPVRIVV